ncbi:MAG: hypothetical protein Q9157_007248 [Trypethelium eluteriae]
MLPARQSEPQYFPARQILGEALTGFVPLEEAACLLAHRLASRAQDDIVIWSLLTNETPYYDAKTWWREKVTGNGTFMTSGAGIRGFIHSGFLLSSAPRLKGVKSLQWAPTQPGLHLPQGVSNSTKVYQPEDGSNTTKLRIFNEGLVGRWGAYIFRTNDIPSDDSVTRKLQDIAKKFLSHKWGILLSPLTQMFYIAARHDPQRGRLRMADTRYMMLPFRGTSYFLFGVAGANDRESWEWQGVCEWPTAQPLPDFSNHKEILLV